MVIAAAGFYRPDTIPHQRTEWIPGYFTVNVLWVAAECSG